MPVGKKLYVLDMFPYPSGDGLHVGHPEGYTATDIVCRYKRMRGRSVLHPMGWDAFGLPAEQHAIRTGTPPRTTTEKNIATFRRQLQMLGFSYDWDREVEHDRPGLLPLDAVDFPAALQLVLRRRTSSGPARSANCRFRPTSSAAGRSRGPPLSRREPPGLPARGPVNWCPALGTVLANEEVKDGLSERGSHPVVRIPLRQWMLRITAYAERLERRPGAARLVRRHQGAAAQLDRPQRRRRGRFLRRRRQLPLRKRARSRLCRLGRGPRDERLSTQAGRRRAADLHHAARHAVRRHVHGAGAGTSGRRSFDDAAAGAPPCAPTASKPPRKSDLDRTDLAKIEDGVFTGAYAINPVNGEPMPIWIADYVLMGYGTGAIMAVPAHDMRDFEFAQQFGLPIVPVVDPRAATTTIRNQVRAGAVCYADEGVGDQLRRLRRPEDGRLQDRRSPLIWPPRGSAARRSTTNCATGSSAGSTSGASRFRSCTSWTPRASRPAPARARGEGPAARPAGDDALQAARPPRAAAGRRPQDWLYPTIDGVRYKRETNTMPQWAGSCWYYLRFIDPKNEQALVDPALEKAWMPVDLYVGGAEHAVLHLLYARFWHKVLFDLGLVSTPEPFAKLVNQGMILGEMEITGYQDAAGRWVSAQRRDDQRSGQADSQKRQAPN